jgi:putative glycosyltransferase
MPPEEPHQTHQRVALSIVSTLYFSKKYIQEFCRRSAAAAERLVGHDYEIVLVNDGSPDESLDMAIDLVRDNPRIVVVDLSRNFGHHKAMMTGLQYSRGQQIFLMDSDLEEDPEWLENFAAKLQEHRCDVVYGVQINRKGDRVERWTGTWFYRIFNSLTGLALPENIVVARLMTRRYVDALLQHDEREVFMAGLWQITGFAQAAIPVVKHSRAESTYSLKHKVELLVNSVTSFSNVPLYAIFYIGVTISLFAGIGSVYIVALRLFSSTPLSGWTSVMASIWLIGGLIISFVGIIGIYLAKVFSETKRRPYTIVREVYRAGHDSDGIARSLSGELISK